MKGPPAAVHVPAAAPEGPPLLLIHGISLGAWLWERDQRILASMGFSSWAMDLPGHGDDAGRDVRMEDVYRAVRDAVSAFDEPPILVGHSAGGLAAQVVAAEVDVAAVVLVAPVPCGSVPHLPTRAGIGAILPSLLAVVRGRNLTMGRRAYVDTGLSLLTPADQERAMARIGPWPNGMVRDMVRRRPVVTAQDIGAPILVTHGLNDGAASLYGSRLLADHYDCVLWRFDDLAHLPQLEPGGERHTRAVGEWMQAPHGRQVREIDAFRPDEGVGRARRVSRDPSPARSDSRFGDRRKR
ncbi:MAG: alpha/beta hydrolase [Proteobacteria bacterium]|nr:alpha/beta hydrolase [Pseudomonadota bacterium]MCP4916896.1 alpha/beta hydrolase [Pseudomonadota bacterium]